MAKGPEGSFSLKSIIPAIAMIAGCAGAQRAETSVSENRAVPVARSVHGCPDGSKLVTGPYSREYPNYGTTACLDTHCGHDLDELRNSCQTKVLKVQGGKWTCGGDNDQCYK
jgi:hypothetical protein